MKKITLIIISISIVYLAKAQYISVDNPQYKIVHRDTINIRGIVLDFWGTPLAYAQVHSKNDELIFSGLPIYTMTDKDGKFVLNGALPKDTLEIFWKQNLKIVNNGSRYLEIRLPFTEQDVKIKGTGQIVANRKSKKPPAPEFKVLTNAQVADYYGVGGFLALDASFRGGPEAFVDYLNMKVIYPGNAIENNIEGDVEIGFSIERDGSPFNFRVIRGIGYGCDEAVINAIKTCPRWKPGMLNGRMVVCQSSVTINFKLAGK